MAWYKCPKCGKEYYSASDQKENEPCEFCGNPIVNLIDEKKEQ